MKTFFMGYTVLLAVSTLHAAGPVYLADGIKIGEVDQNSAIVWTRLTKEADGDPTQENAAPGVAGWVRLSLWPTDRPDEVIRLEPQPVDPRRDFTLQHRFTDLQPATAYTVWVEAITSAYWNPTASLTGSFRTAPAVDQPAKGRFAVVTCQAITSVDSPTDGHYTYRILDQVRPDFLVHTGDIVYYDRPPLSPDIEKARWKWNRMFCFRDNRRFYMNTPAYFMKDDHDTLKNDCWPGQHYGDLTWEQGLAVFREQTPAGPLPYRTFRWGRDVQIWLSENREYRTPNNVPDGPEKSIWGEEQKRWFTRSVEGSDATWKFLISPGAVVGPDKPGKADSHANACFAHEGAWLRKFLASQKNMFVVCGDRHWQYHSVDPETGLNEFGCGPINDKHNYGGNPGLVPSMHRYFDPGGGFLLITARRREDRPTLQMEYFAGNPPPVDGQRTIRYRKTFAVE